MLKTFLGRSVSRIVGQKSISRSILPVRLHVVEVVHHLPVEVVAGILELTAVGNRRAQRDRFIRRKGASYP